MLSGPQGYTAWTEEMGHLRFSKDRSGNRARNLPAGGAMPQPIAAQLAPLKN